MNILFILNDPPYGTERTYNGLRLAGSLAKDESNLVRVFLIGDAAGAAHAGQKVPPGFYNVEVMLKALARNHGVIGVCGSCMDARGIKDQDLLDGARRSSMEELSQWTAEADKVLVF